MRIYSMSELKQFVDCPQKHEYRYIRQIIPKRSEADARDVGSAIHAGIRSLHETNGNLSLSLDAALSCFNGLEVDSEDLHTVHQAIKKYDAQIATPYYKRTVGTEIILWATLPEIPPFKLVGQLDLVVRNPDNSLTLIDHKTAYRSASPSMYHTAFQLNWQPHGYAYLWNSVYPEDPITSVQFNLIRKTKEVDIQTFYATVTPSTIRDALSNIRQIVSIMQETPRFVWKNPAACTRFNKTCEYANLCLGLPLFPSDWNKPEDRYADDLRKKEEAGALPERGFTFG